MASPDRHNRTILASLTLGDLVQFSRGLYSHWGVYVGNGLIVHLAGEDNDGLDGKIRPEHAFTISGKTFDKARVCVDNFLSVAGESMAKINNTRDSKMKPFHPDEIVKNALDRVGEVGYSLMFKNCEHFAKWCRYGVEKSDQVETFLTGAAVGAAAGLTLGLINAAIKYWGRDTEDPEEEKKQKR